MNIEIDYVMENLSIINKKSKVSSTINYRYTLLTHHHQPSSSTTDAASRSTLHDEASSSSVRTSTCVRTALYERGFSRSFPYCSLPFPSLLFSIFLTEPQTLFREGRRRPTDKNATVVPRDWLYVVQHGKKEVSTL